MSNYSKTRYNRTKEFWMKKRKHELTELPDWYSDIEKRYIEAIRKKNEIDDELSEIRNELLSCMKEDKLNKIITNDTEVYVIRSYNGRKIDTNKLKNREIIYTNTIDIDGIDSLKKKISSMFKLEELKKKDYNFITNIRQIAKIKECIERINDVKDALNKNMTLDIIEIDLKEIWNILGEIIGESYSEELLDELFSKFCVGK
jgi:tRNA modification GTPase